MMNQDTVNAEQPLKTELGTLVGEKTKQQLYELPRQAGGVSEPLGSRALSLAFDVLKLGRDVLFVLPIPGKQLLARFIGRGGEQSPSASERKAA